MRKETVFINILAFCVMGIFITSCIRKRDHIYHLHIKTVCILMLTTHYVTISLGRIKVLIL